MQFDEVKPEHFSMISRDPLPHTLIDRTISQLGGSDVKGAQFRKDALAAAGWKHDGLVSFMKYPDLAASAFNKIRAALAETEDPEALLAKLKS
ncbi:hypothetical protein KSF73_07110 [Burkholderiaceae bacterium DAT-1]|nr:hypothetical protein [Burkholderiaceae bacterium DAT-1]